MIAGGLMIRGSIIGIRRYHHLLVAHEVNIEGDADGQLQDVKNENVRSVHRTGEPTNVGVVHLPQVAMQLVEHNGLVKVAGCKVGGARGSEGHTQWLRERIKRHGE